MDRQIETASAVIKKSKHLIAFTGAGISVESGIPAFRGTQGVWTKYDPKVLDLDYFLENPERCWTYIRKIFYEYFDRSQPNQAHLVMARLEKKGVLKSVVTQNIDNLHQEAGSHAVREFHGNSKQLICLKCGRKYAVSEFDLDRLPPKCKHDGTVLKPNFIFFGEGIPEQAYSLSVSDARQADVCLVVGSTGEVVPAAYIPRMAKEHGATIIEINPEISSFTGSITDIYLPGKAAEVLVRLEQILLE
ncbi:MAG: NAD-dependent deacetylase [Mangrovibacterium sp.]